MTGAWVKGRVGENPRAKRTSLLRAKTDGQEGETKLKGVEGKFEPTEDLKKFHFAKENVRRGRGGDLTTRYRRGPSLV